MNDVFTSL